MKLIFERSVPGRSTAYLPEAPRTDLGFPLRESRRACRNCPRVRWTGTIRNWRRKQGA